MEVTALSSQWKREFTRVADKRREDILEAQARVNQHWRDEAKKDKEDELKQRDAMIVQEIILASATDIEHFEVKLDTYDQATVEALMRNSERLEAVNDILKPYLEQAYVLPDGTRVFRTKDGTQVFDEHGKEVAADKIDPKDIGEGHPFWEQVKDKVIERNGLNEERRQLIEYQEKLDKSRDRIRSGEPITDKDLKAMEEDLGASMPDAIRQKLPAKDRAELDAKHPAVASTDITMDDLDEMAEMSTVKTAISPKAPTLI